MLSIKKIAVYRVFLPFIVLCALIAFGQQGLAGRQQAEIRGMHLRMDTIQQQSQRMLDLLAA